MTASRPVRVFLADDHSIVRAGIRQILQNSALIEIVGEAADGRSALDGIQNSSPDVALVDIQMPEMTGIELTHRLREMENPVGILILTAYDDPPYLHAGLRAGANGYVLKTADPAEIIRAVMDVFQGKQVLDLSLSDQRESANWSDPDGKAVLSEREIEVLSLVRRGLTNKAVALELGISEKTVQNHLSRIFRSLHAVSRTDAVIKAIRLHIIPDGSI